MNILFQVTYLILFISHKRQDDYHFKRQEYFL